MHVAVTELSPYFYKHIIYTCWQEHLNHWVNHKLYDRNIDRWKTVCAETVYLRLFLTWHTCGGNLYIWRPKVQMFVFDSYNYKPLALFLYLEVSNITHSVMSLVSSAQQPFEVVISLLYGTQLHFIRFFNLFIAYIINHIRICTVARNVCYSSS